MEKPNTPSKEQIRAWLLGRRSHRMPLPSAQEIRRELGWNKAPLKSAPCA
ncbi:MAG: hypothetical protein V4724_07685 [Pseudomonadota bacterium]